MVKIKNYFDWIKIYLDNMKKQWSNKKNISFNTNLIDWIKIYIDIMKKSDIMQIYFIEYKFILIEENILWYKNFYFCNISATIPEAFYRNWWS